nr:hypothetical protein [Tanacetum cinerariifolium]
MTVMMMKIMESKGTNLEHQFMDQNRLNWNMLNQMACSEEIDEMLTIKLCVAGTHEEIFTLEAWTNAFNIDEPIYCDLCHELYSTYEFDKVYADDEGQLGMRTTGYDKMQKNDLWLLSMFEAKHQNGYADIVSLIARWMKRKGVGSQKESMISRGQFIIMIAKRKTFLSVKVLNSLRTLIYCKALNTTTLRDLIDSEGWLIPEVLEPGVPRAAIPRPPKASMQDLYERMGSMEIHHGAIERMSYRQSYH